MTLASSVRRTSQVRGFTLLEVLVALLIFSIGLIGMASLLVVSLKTNYIATQRSQATFLSQSLADRMRANIIGVWQANYNGTWTGAGAPPAASCDLTATGCSPANTAAWDLSVWFDQVRQSLPNPAATINCVQSAAGAAIAATSYATKPPYEGVCTLQMSWKETLNTAATDTQTATTNRTFSWVFVP